jgi:signal peptidase complex subunit 3
LLAWRSVDLRFDADVNVSGVFNWNTKQVFVYVQADVETVNGRRFRQVVWDEVVNRTDSQQLRLRQQAGDYPLLMVSMFVPGRCRLLVRVPDFLW